MSLLQQSNALRRTGGSEMQLQGLDGYLIALRRTGGSENWNFNA